MKKSLSSKLFLTILTFFIIMILGIVIFLDVYFNRFYETAKINQTIKSINDLAAEYTINNWGSQERYRELNLFSTRNNVKVTIGNVGSGEDEEENHSENEGDFVLITIFDASNHYYDFFLSDEFYTDNPFKKGDTITIIGNHGKDGVIVPRTINGISVSGESEEKGGGSSYSGQGTIVSIKQDLTVSGEREENTMDATKLYTKEKDGVSYTASEVPYTGYKQITYKRIIKPTGGSPVVLTVVGSLQPVSETLGIIKGFYPHFLLVSILLSLIVSIVYSRGVSRPIVKITSVADSMAKMDFDEKLAINREDELGKLSNSLNILSTNLEQSLSDLRVANEKLQEDYQREKKQEQARKEFIANASHELKTPLGIIKSYAEGLQDSVNKEEQDEYIHIINDEIGIMDKLIMEMLKISKYDSMDMTIEKEEVDLTVLIYGVIENFEQSLRKNDLLVNVEGEFHTCYADEEKLNSAFLNLFSNAVKYANRHSTIHIKGIPVSEKTRIEIYNDCDQFTDEQLEKIWDRFYKVDTSHNTDIEGTGLGLSIVKSIFEAHSIEYGVMNTPKGVMFWFQV